MDIEDFICEKVAQIIATDRIANNEWNSQYDMRINFEKEAKEVKSDKELRTVIRKLLNEK